MCADVTQINYQQLEMIARRFTAESEEIAEMAQRMQRDVECLRASDWQGSAAEKFEKEMFTRVLPGLRRLAQALAAASETTVAIWRIYRKNEEDAARLFQTVGIVDGNVKPAGLIENARGVWQKLMDAARENLVILFPYKTEEAVDFMKTTPAGTDLLAAANKNRVTFTLENGDRYGFEGEGGTEIKIKLGRTANWAIAGYYDLNTREIVIDDRVFRRARGLDGYADTLAHEMQHALDNHNNLIVNSLVGNEELRDYFSTAPEMQESIRQRLGDELESHLDTEVRAWERGGSVSDGSSFDDDGVYTLTERNRIFSDRGYKAYYENSLAENFPGKEFDLALDQHGQVQVSIQASSSKEDGWWIF